MAWRNLFRHKRRNLTALAALILGLAGLVVFQGYLSQTMRGYRDSTIRSGLGHLQLAASESYFADGEFNPYAYPLAGADKLARVLAADPRVESVFPSTGFTAIAGMGEKSTTLLVKAYPPEAGKFYQGTLVAGSSPGRGTRHGLVLGETAARILKATVGSVVTLMAILPEGGLDGQDFSVTGIYSSAGRDKIFAFTDYETAREFTRLAGPPVLHVLLRDQEDTAAVAALVHQGSSTTVIRTWRDLAGFYLQVNAMFQSFLGVIRLILLLITLFLLANTMNRIVHERTREWATLRALGTKRPALVALVVTEGVFLGLVGAVLGITSGFVFSLGINAFGGIPFHNGPETFLIKVTPDDQSVWANLVPVMVTAALASFFPALKAVRMTPSEGLRHV